MPCIDVKEVAVVVARCFQVEVDELLVKRSRHRQARRFLLGLCYDLLGGRRGLSAIGAQLGSVGAAALCCNQALLQEELSHDKKLLHKYREIQKRIGIIIKN